MISASADRVGHRRAGSAVSNSGIGPDCETCLFLDERCMLQLPIRAGEAALSVKVA